MPVPSMIGCRSSASPRSLWSTRRAQLSRTRSPALPLRSRTGDVAVVYFSGHAGRVGGEFTLLAADAPPQGTRERRQQPFGLLLTTIADEIRVAGAQAQIFFIDACRGDPYVSSTPEIGPSSCGDLKEPLPDRSLSFRPAPVSAHSAASATATRTRTRSLRVLSLATWMTRARWFAWHVRFAPR
jgi:hypothetical protein